MAFPHLEIDNLCIFTSFNFYIDIPLKLWKPKYTIIGHRTAISTVFFLSYLLTNSEDWTCWPNICHPNAWLWNYTFLVLFLFLHCFVFVFAFSVKDILILSILKINQDLGNFCSRKPTNRAGGSNFSNQTPLLFGCDLLLSAFDILPQITII